MPTFYQGAVTPSQVSTVIPVDIYGIAIDWFAPRSPLQKLLRMVPNSSPSYTMAVGAYRSRTTTLGASVADTSTTTVQVASAGIAQQFMKGDILRLNSGELVEVNADPTSGSANLTVIRGVAGTSTSIQSSGTTVRLVGNARTGATDNPTAYSVGRGTLTQYAQTILHPYQVGGGVQSTGNFPTAPGASSPLDMYRMEAMQNCSDDIEMSACYGVAESTASATSTSAKMGGLRSILATNRVTSPTNASAYKATDFQRDLLDTPRSSGGQPDMIFVGSNWMSAFTLWSQPLSFIAQDDNAFGRNIKIYRAPFLGDVQIVEHSLLPSYVAFSLNQNEVTWQVKRAMQDQPYGVSGDNTKGHILAELSIAVENESHHAWLEGVTAFSA